MKSLTLSGFTGIFPRYSPNLKPGMAETAQNCDLTSGRLKALPEDTTVATNSNNGNHMIYFDGSWLVAKNACYNQWNLDDKEILIYLEDGVPKKRIGDTIVSLGHGPPATAVSLTNRTTRLTLSDTDLFEWRKSGTNQELYCVRTRSFDNILDEPCSNLGTWVDDDAGAGVSSQVTLGTRETFKFGANTASIGCQARRYKDIGNMQSKYRVSIILYHTALGTLGDSDYFLLTFDYPTRRIRIAWASDGIWVRNNSTWVQVGTSIPTTGTWDQYTIDIDTVDLTKCRLAMAKNGVSIGSNINCRFDGSFTNGTVWMTQYGTTTDGMLTYVDQLKIGEYNADGPGVPDPDRIKINGEVATEGTIGDLKDGEWDYGDNDSLGFNTVYIRIGSLAPDHAGQMSWQPSAHGTSEFYLVPEGLQVKDFPKATGAHMVLIDGVLYTQGIPGSLGEEEFGWGNTDGLSADTLYIRMEAGHLPTDEGRNIRIITSTYGMIAYVTDSEQSQSTEDSEFEVILEIEPGEVDGSVYYVICTERDTAGHLDKSGPGPVSNEITVDMATIRVMRPAITEDGVVSWYLYRLSNASAEYEFVAKKAIGDTYHDDTLADADLGEALDTEYTGSKTGITITYAPSTSPLDGLCTGLYYSMMFSWKGSTLNWCEPGKPDVWPLAYSINLLRNIKNVVVSNRMACVLCEDGPYLLEGNHPELLKPTPATMPLPCIATSACAADSGVAFFSPHGISIFDGANLTTPSLEWFTAEWFRENLHASNAILVAHDKKIYLLDPVMTLVLDLSLKPIALTSLDDLCRAAYVSPYDGYLHLLSQQSILKVAGSLTAQKGFTWKSGRIYADIETVDKDWMKVRLTGSGNITVTLFSADVQVASKTMNLDSYMDRDKDLWFPEHSRSKYCAVQLSGNGRVDNVMIGYAE